jgi:hypothetical protein
MEGNEFRRYSSAPASASSPASLAAAAQPSLFPADSGERQAHHGLQRDRQAGGRQLQDQ